MSRYALVRLMVAFGAVSAALGSPPVAVAGDANVAACPVNEGLSGFEPYMPDCRAYEMVSPAYKNGNELGVAAISDEGSKVLVETTAGAFGGSQADPLGAFYELSRSESGWSVSALNPPGTEFPAQQLLAVGDNLGETLWALRTGSQSIYAEDLYVREADGTLVRVGAMVPPSREAGPPAGEYPWFEWPVAIGYRDASRDLSHVLFSIIGEGPLWPGDTTQHAPGSSQESLYEYAERGSARPNLVGVSDGATVIDGETVPAGELLSDCETALGSGQSADVYNAMSEDGETVFFTAAGKSAAQCAGVAGRAPEVSELYARLGGTETVAVSEPPAQQCAACNTTVRKPAEFAGASEDGSKAFFLTEQELLPEARTTNLYEYDFDAPARAKLVRVSVGSEEAEVQGVARVSEDGSHVYFIARGVLTSEPRGGTPGGRPGVCLAELSPAELLAEEVGKEGRCRAKKGADNLYVFERDSTYPTGHVAFVATLCSGVEESGGATGVAQCPSSSSDAEDWSQVDDRRVQATPDGRFLVFQSVGDLTAAGASSSPQVFEYDAASEELVRVSVAQSGYAPGAASANTAGASIPPAPYAQEAFSPGHPVSDLVISDDGSTVIFSSAGTLTGEAAATGANVYEYRSAGAIRAGNVYLISDGGSTAESRLVGLDGSGADLFFQTPAPLLASDGDTQWDVYDARIDGGFPAPTPPASCAGEECRFSPALAQPSFGVPLSATATSSGNLAPPPLPTQVKPSAKKKIKCAKDRRLEHGKCVKAKGRKRTKKAKSHRGVR